MEPVIAIFYLVIALSGIPGEELYLKKACLVNLNHTREVCDNIYQHKEVQIETQKYVSGIQVRKGVSVIWHIVTIILVNKLCSAKCSWIALLPFCWGFI